MTALEYMQHWKKPFSSSFPFLMWHTAPGFPLQTPQLIVPHSLASTVSLNHASFIQHMFLRYCFSSLTFLMLSSLFLHFSTQKCSRTFHFKFQDPILTSLVISNTIKMIPESEQKTLHIHTSRRPTKEQPKIRCSMVLGDWKFSLAFYTKHSPEGLYFKIANKESEKTWKVYGFDWHVCQGSERVLNISSFTKQNSVMHGPLV